MSSEKKYRLLQQFRSPSKTINVGVIKTAVEWYREFEKDDPIASVQFINDANKYCEIKKDWFEFVVEKAYTLTKFDLKPGIYDMQYNAYTAFEQLDEFDRTDELIEFMLKITINRIKKGYEISPN